MIAAMAQWEREEIADRVAASVPIRAKLGKPTGGQASFGYEWKNGALVPHPQEAPVRKLIYELFQEHRRKKTVARLLNEKGYRTRNGSLFTDTTIERLINDPTAKGIRRANYTATKDAKKAWTLKPESEWVLHPVPAIVSEDLWNECNALLIQRRANKKPPARKTVQLFAGLTHCGCGEKMYVPSNTPKYVCQSCRNKIPVVDLEAVFQEQLKSFFFSPTEIAGALDRASAHVLEKEELIGSLEAERAKVKAEIDKLYDLYLASKVSKDGFGERFYPLEARTKQLDEELPRLQAELDVMLIGHLSGQEVVSEARDLYSKWSDLPLPEKRQIVETIVEKIVIDNDEVEINLLYFPNLNDGSKATRPQGCGGDLELWR